MTEHHHYDLDAMERQIRAQFAEMMRAMRHEIATGNVVGTAPEDLDWQERFFEVLVVAMRTIVDADNHGRDASDIAADLGHCLGAIMGSFGRSRPEHIRALNFAINEAFAGTMSGDVPEGRGMVATGRVEPVPAGHA